MSEFNENGCDSAESNGEVDLFNDEADLSRPAGPLSKRPKARSLLPAVIMLVLCALASVIFWRQEFGSYLPVSASLVYQQHQYWRLLTAVFTHSNIAHLLANTPLLIIFGWFLRNYFGAFAFPVLSLCVGVLTNAAAIVFMFPTQRLVGASGMVYAMVALWLVYYLRYETAHGFGNRLMRVVGFSLVVMFPSTYNPTTSYLAHGVGFILGLCAGGLSCYFVKPIVYNERQDV